MIYLNVTIHIGIQFLILHLEYAFYNALLHAGSAQGQSRSKESMSPANLPVRSVFICLCVAKCVHMVCALNLFFYI
jgi:hypothetical protein